MIFYGNQFLFQLILDLCSSSLTRGDPLVRHLDLPAVGLLPADLGEQAVDERG